MTDEQIIEAILQHERIRWRWDPTRVQVALSTRGGFTFEIEGRAPNRLLLIHRATASTRQVLEAGAVWRAAEAQIAERFASELVADLGGES